MKYPYISLDPIISEVQAQLRTMFKMGKLDTDDCYQYAVQCLRKIGSHQYDTVEEIKELKNHRLTLDNKGFHSFEEVRLLEGCNDIESIVHYQHKTYTKGIPLKPVDSLSVTYCNSQYMHTISDMRHSNYIGFTFRAPPGVLQCDLRDGLLFMKYSALKRDEEGNYMVQNEENSIDAIKNFIKMQALEEDYLLQKIPRYLYVDIQASFENSLSMAQSALLEMGPTEIYHLVEKDKRKFNKFNLR